MTHSKLGKNYIYNLLHDALTSRIKGTNRHFTHLIRNRKGDWIVIREDQLGIAYLEENGDLVVVGQYAILEEGCGSNEVPLKFDLADYRPCKLTAIKIGEREIPKVIGGGSVFNFVEDLLDQTYQWYIDNDIERPEHDITHAYDLELKQIMKESKHSQEALESPVEEDKDEVAPEDQNPEEDPFNALYRRDPVERKRQWGESVVKKPLFSKEIMETAKVNDPTRFDIPEEKQLRDYLIELCNGDTTEEELNMLVCMCRSLSPKYTMIRRTPKGSIIAKALEDSNGIIIYHNPESQLCSPDKPSIAFKLKDEFLRFHRNK